MRIGYQGDIGSNAEAAAKRIEGNHSLIPLVSSLNVIEALKNNQVDLGVVAVRNSIAGEVLETKEALQLLDYEILKEIILPIEHYLFVREDSSPFTLECIYSHPMALAQTRKNRSLYFPSVKEAEYTDTALAAKDLMEGKLPPRSGVLCRYDCGIYYKLLCISDNLSDNMENETTFLLIQRKK